jgi:ribosome-binding protein aMBF1 (putative translation factor)
MIKNDKQYKITIQRLNEFLEAYEKTENDKSEDNLMKELKLNAFNFQIKELQNEIDEYEKLKKGLTNSVTIDAIEKIPEVLIKARIAKGWSQSDLANVLEMKEQQIQRYESDNYSTASIWRISKIIEVLDVYTHNMRFDVKKPEFLVPKGWDSANIEAAQQIISERKSLLQL